MHSRHTMVDSIKYMGNSAQQLFNKWIIPFWYSQLLHQGLFVQGCMDQRRLLWSTNWHLDLLCRTGSMPTHCQDETACQPMVIPDNTPKEKLHYCNISLSKAARHFLVDKKTEKIGTILHSWCAAIAQYNNTITVILNQNADYKSALVFSEPKIAL